MYKIKMKQNLLNDLTMAILYISTCIMLLKMFNNKQRNALQQHILTFTEKPEGIGFFGQSNSER